MKKDKKSQEEKIYYNLDQWMSDFYKGCTPTDAEDAMVDLSEELRIEINQKSSSTRNK